ncbi:MULTISPECIES: hypothetical protein [unclassified Streptomyces]|uniref:hypothetical protein n=1 Tax=unclassified Streptomyces TaxID=2593676 RepID=UPI002E2C6A90|nr:hypothetical protein [Streptomyces sp. NBC_00228]
MKIRTLAAAALLLGCLTACGKAAEAPSEEPASRDAKTSDGSANLEPTPADTAGQADPETTKYLKSVGVTPALVEKLAVIGQANNYGISIEKPMTAEQKQGLAVGQVMNCQDVNIGERTYQDLKEDDMSSGATQEQVDEMYGFLKSSFCPYVQPERAS